MCKRHIASRGPAFFLTALVVPMLVMAGCEVPPEEDPDVMPEWTEEERPDTVEFSANFTDVRETGVSGEATVMRPAENGVAIVLLDLTDLPEEGEYPATVHQGTCEAMGPEVANLNPVRALADRTGQSQTTLETGEIPMEQDLSIHVHDPQQQSVACADIDRDEWDRDRMRERDRERQPSPDYRN